MEQMRELYSEGLANHTGPESCGVSRKSQIEALTGVHAGRKLSHEIHQVQGADVVPQCGRQHRQSRNGEAQSTLRGHRTRACMEPSCARTGRACVHPLCEREEGSFREASGRNPEMYEHRQSYWPIVPTKPTNKERKY